MTTRTPHTPPQLHRTRGYALLAAFALTLIGGNAQAVTFPTVPLQTAAEFPPPNVRFILDDSGSMGWVAMPADVSDGNLQDTIFHKSYIHNTLYYNPAITYKGWLQWDGTRDTTGTSYSNAWSDTDALSSAVDLANKDQVYFVPKAGANLDLNNPSSYYRYALLAGSPVQLQKSEFAAFSGFPKSNLSATTNNMLQVGSFVVAAGTTQITVVTSGGTHGTDSSCTDNGGNGVSLYLRLGAQPSTSSFTVRSSNGGDNDETVTIDNPAAGTWHVGMFANSCFKNAYVEALFPQQLSLTTATTADKTNYATWYSYHRSRIKTAKAGASEAFGGLTENSRVGFDTINRNTSGLPFDIPVNNNNGLFSGTNKQNWYTKLFAAVPNNSTPLRRAINRAGDYFSRADADGPWGPGSGSAQITCRQNFAILTTDGFWNGDSSGFTSAGDADGTAGPTHTPEGVTPVKINGVDFTGYVVENPYKDNFTGSPSSASDTLADMAMKYWKTDLRPNFKNNVPPSNADPAFWQHMVTFGVSIGLQGTLNPKTELPAIKAGSTHWPNPFVNTSTGRIDDLWHASVNGHGQFVVASNSESFQKGLQDAFETIAQKQGTGSGLAANSTTFVDQTRLYQASFTTKTWTGELQARSVTTAGVGSTLWSASTGIPAAASRNILTWNGSAGATFPTAAQTTALDQSARSLSPVSGADNAAYIRGDQSKEGEGTGKGLRVRSTLLGDIVDSSPIFVNQSNTVFVGANDGMLHAVNANDGTERFAYLPGGIDLTALASLSDPFYSHKYFVDGQITVSTDNQTPGKTILVGALGRGGRGLYALDVTSPGSMTADKVLWELSTGDNLGNVIGTPLIAKLNDSDKTPVVIFGNGPNSQNQHAVLYVVNLQTGAVLHTLDTGVGGDNALISPRLANTDADSAGTVDAVYAGDLKGNLWKFDFSKAQFTASSAPKIALSGSPLFTTATGQPITGGLALATDPNTQKVWVFFGTGSFLTSTDPSVTTVQSMYGIKDDAVTSTLHRSDLQQRAIAAVSSDQKQRAFTPHAPLEESKKGWYIDLGNPLAGERVVSRPTILEGNALVVVSIVPQTNNACEASGVGFLNALDAFTGTAIDGDFFLGSGGSGLSFDSNGTSNKSGSLITDGLPSGDVTVISGNGSLLLTVGVSSASGPGIFGAGGKPPPSKAVRASWREIINN